uniref:Uncharacterized protein n=1 Tax=Anguilla anguilla TaxID=7936 RepID=A0A0E9SUT2_ANGAN
MPRPTPHSHSLTQLSGVMQRGKNNQKIIQLNIKANITEKKQRQKNCTWTCQMKATSLVFFLA